MVRRAGAWAALAVIALELCARSVARRSIAHAVSGWTPDLSTLVLIAVIAGAVLVVSDRRRATAPVFATLFCLGMAAQLTLGARLQSDGFYYYAYLRSMAFDHDVDFTNDYRMLGLGSKTNLFVPTLTGYAQSAWTIGPAIAWSPFFAAGHIVAARLHAAGVGVSVDGTSYPYRQSICVAGLFYGLLGCWFMYGLARRFFATSTSVLAVTTVVGGSFILWYLVQEPTMTHAPSMASVAAFVWLWAATRDGRSLRGWAALGLLAGLMALIRWQNALFMLLPASDVLPVLWSRPTGEGRAAFVNALRGSAVFLTCAVLGFLPQMIAWKSIYGSYIARSPVGPAIFWTHPHLVDVLWSARNGLFSTSPVLYLATIGLVAFALVRPAIGVPALVSLALMAYFNACIQDWWGSAAFGARRFDGVLPMLVLGGGALIDGLVPFVRRHAGVIVGAALSSLVVWNAALAAAAHRGAVRIGETTAADRAWAAQAYEVHRWFGNPFSYPASLIFAIRNDVSPGDYDLLGGSRFLGDPLRPYGRIDIGSDDDFLVGAGWYAPESEGPITYRWSDAASDLRVPLDHPDNLRIQIRLHAFGYAGAPPQALTVVVNGTSCAPVDVPAEWTVVECTMGERAWRSGVNRLVLQFGWARRPADVGAGSDQRSLAAAVDYVRVSVVPADQLPR